MSAYCTISGVVYQLRQGHDFVSVDSPVPSYTALTMKCRVTAGSDTTDADRAPIRMTHDTQYLTISQDEANKIDEEAKRRLLAARKLSLVVDLDQTIIHAAVDPTIAEWQKDIENPNYEAVKDVRAFQLIDDGPGMRGCWYYIKLRPGLEQFLESISEIYEMHIYTMGTRQYAQQIANIVDPSRKFFGERILSRDESGSMVAKNLERLFPVDTKMVVIIDDRGDVWKWSANLVRVTPFEFFVGIGDINSSFLPKKQEIQAIPKHHANREATANDVNERQNGQDRDHRANGVAEDETSTIQNGTSALEQLVAMGGGDDPTVRELQSKGQEEIISSQLEEKPLLKMQMEQDEKDEAEAMASESSTNGDAQITNATDSDSSDSSESSTSSPSSTAKAKARHSILKNDDVELAYLEASLTAIHTAFFNEYDRKRLSSKGGRVAALSGKRKAPLRISDDGDDAQAADLMLVPDIKKVMPSMKTRVLAGVIIVFSGVLPLGTDIQNADISTWAKTFGARIVERIGRDVTHVIAARPGTAKVKQAVRRGIKVVSTPWLIESMQRWRKLDERPYLLERVGRQKDDLFSEVGDGGERTTVSANDFLLSSSDGEGETTGLDTEDEAPARKKLKVNTAAATRAVELQTIDEVIGMDGEEDREIYDDQSPLTIDQNEWDDIDQELKEFMGSEADSESDNESVTSRLSLRGTRKRKRDAGDGESGTEESDIDNEGRRRTGVGGGSTLRAVANAGSERGSTGPSTPSVADGAIREEQSKVEVLQETEEAEEEDSDDELARELERELEDADSGDEEGFMGDS
jgi:RNA polymerase II subunit A C-terminal domain phosphatase